MPGDFQVEMMALLRDGELERTSFPRKGQVVDGVIYLKEDTKFLIPLSTIGVGPDADLGSIAEMSFEEET